MESIDSNIWAECPIGLLNLGQYTKGQKNKIKKGYTVKQEFSPLEQFFFLNHSSKMITVKSYNDID